MSAKPLQFVGEYHINDQELHLYFYSLTIVAINLGFIIFWVAILHLSYLYFRIGSWNLLHGRLPGGWNLMKIHYMCVNWRYTPLFPGCWLINHQDYEPSLDSGIPINIYKLLSFISDGCNRTTRNIVGHFFVSFVSKSTEVLEASEFARLMSLVNNIHKKAG